MFVFRYGIFNEDNSRVLQSNCNSISDALVKVVINDLFRLVNLTYKFRRGSSAQHPHECYLLVKTFCGRTKIFSFVAWRCCEKTAINPSHLLFVLPKRLRFNPMTFDFEENDLPTQNRPVRFKHVNRRPCLQSRIALQSEVVTRRDPTICKSAKHINKLHVAVCLADMGEYLKGWLWNWKPSHMLHMLALPFPTYSCTFAWDNSDAVSCSRQTFWWHFIQAVIGGC